MSIKIIQDFREKEDAMFIDLMDARGAICIDKNSGNILFNEGPGEDRYEGMASRASAFKKFLVSAIGKEGGGKVSLCFAGQTHFLGYTTNFKLAWDWTHKAAALLRSKHKPAHSQPQVTKKPSTLRVVKTLSRTA